MVDILNISPSTGDVEWKVEAVIDLVGSAPAITNLSVSNPGGMDPVHLQRFFRWSTPLDVVARLVPELVRAGKDPFAYEYPTDGFPDAASFGRRPCDRLTDAFLEEIAGLYVSFGRGYAKQIAKQRGVSPRTVVSWVEKARRRGILTRGCKGRYGGEVVPTTGQTTDDGTQPRRVK